MKKFLIVPLAAFISLCVQGQILNPAQWNFTARKIDDKTYEIQLKAVIESPWHIYSQFTQAGGPAPTRVTFLKNPLLSLTEGVKEIGEMETKYEKVFGVDVKYFTNRVMFTQTVKMKAPVKTNISGTIEYMCCTEEKCLAPKTVKFSIPLK